MRFPRVSHTVCAMVGFLLLAGCHESPKTSNGWGLTDLPDTAPAYQDVLDAAKGVIKEKYPRSSASSSKESGFVYAVTPVAMTGGSKTRKQISVMILRNFTGAYEPVVRVRQYVEVGTPALKGNPESGSAARAFPLADNAWHALDYLPYEEQAIYDAIMKRLTPSQS